MVIMPREFVATKYPGYFWHTTTRTLFTAKLGVLRELKYFGPNRWNRYREGYRVCHEGNRQFLSLKYLNTLREAETVFPVDYTLVVKEGDDIAIDVSSFPAGTVFTIKVR